MISTFYAAAWLVIVVGINNGVTAIPMPSMMLCHQEAESLNKDLSKRGYGYCIAGQDTRTPGETK